jgi:hypothetical protein
VEVAEIRQIADRKQISSSPLNSQVIDFNCLFVISGSGNQGGGHYRKGYSRQSVMELLPLLSVRTGANKSDYIFLDISSFPPCKGNLDNLFS